MKESITKFDLEAAFKALDEIEAPKADKIKANRPALTEIFSRKTKLDALMEEYYDISDMSDLDSAKEAREAEVAQAKLARIEKIVDLDAESPEDLLPSYVGKFIMQCPQCMTLFYKDPEDVEASEEDPTTVNVNEVCQHCGNESGYTLIGKVGEATEDEMADFNQEETVDVASTEENEEELEITEDPVEEPSEDELELDLDELDLDIAEDEEAEKTEESFNVGSGEVLVEKLSEDKELDVSADEFEKLIKSPEFKKPISDTEARAMMDEAGSDGEEVTEDLVTEELDPDSFLADSIYDLFNSGKFIFRRYIGSTPPITKKVSEDTYKVVHRNGGAEILVKFDTSNPDSSALTFSINNKKYTNKQYAEAQDIILKELENARFSQFDLALDEQTEPERLDEGIFDKLKGKFADTVDNIASKLKSREAKANWLLANTMKDYNDIKVTADGQLAPSKNNNRFKTFVVVGFTSRNNKGELIKAAPDFDDDSLVLGKNGTQYKVKYEDADKIAKGWSMVQGNGPAFIYMANGKDDENALFLCEYFMGNLANDQVEKYFKIVKNHLKGAKLMADGGMTNQEESKAAAESTNITDSKEATNESLTTVLNDVEELQEAILEKLISDSLVESYGNVAGFRLTESTFENNKFAINGTIFFTSGNKRKTSYVFSEAFIANDGKVSLYGLNEKLGIDKQFTITGHTDNTKTFITESFKTIRK